MNRFRTKKRAKDDFAAPRPSLEAESSKPFRMFTKRRAAEEPKKEVDIATALPPSDDFRTSLLMTGLSARFSMLREQDDPNSKLGKASDDSVLFPKRQSRLDFAMSSGLHDIAEVESIRAPFTRMDSYLSDDAASTSGSVMSRGKPTEGNNLFGGRQKIYRITTGGPSKDGMPGRALYEDDVALSAFQKWKRKNQQSPEDDGANGMPEPDFLRSDSPQLDYNRRRETSSTTSSGPRNSTAATSVASSQLGSSVRDWQPATATTQANPASSAAFPDRAVPRTRRLYEQGLTQEMHDQQTSAQSRFDTASRQRMLGSRTPDLNPNSPSPTSNSFLDRATERRPIMSKASAPNLRSFSPPVSASSQASPAETGTKFPGLEPKPTPGATPPLSPPMSEPEDHPKLPIGPNDRGKATAMGVFSRPAQQYDESKYAQRQRQLQQGRETPTNRLRAESNSSVPTSRSRSSSSLHRQPVEKVDTPLIKTEPTVQEEGGGQTFLDDSDDGAPGPLPSESKRSLLAPQVTLERPDDQDHPAFRVSALPTPLSLSSRLSDESPSIFEKPEGSAENSTNISPEDSPTLGPTTGMSSGPGLSGMVRQHLRNDSTASSVYGTASHDAEPEPRMPAYANSTMDHSDMKSNPWRLSEIDRSSPYNSETSPAKSKASTDTRSPPARTSPPSRNVGVGGETEAERDDFARHLADGARRVRERLTSYHDADSGAPPAMLPPPPEMPTDLPPPRPSTLSSLRSKSSLGSLIDRSRDHRDQSQPKAMKMLGLGPSATTATVGSKPWADDENASRKESSSQGDDQSEDDRRVSEDKDDKDEHVHAGLKAFRQARRDLQRMKEKEIQQRHHAAPPPREAPMRERAFTTRAPSQERGPPPVMYNRMPRDEAGSLPGSRSASQAPSERERSGSEASNTGRSHSRPPYLRNGAASHEGHYTPNGTSQHSPMMRSPNMPRSDGIQSPTMGASNASNASSPGLYSRSDSAQGVSTPGLRGYETNQPSPNAVNGVDSRTSMDGPYGRRPIRKGDISVPTFVATTSQVPTIPLDGQHGGWPRNGGQPAATTSTPNLHANVSAPPLPPINPRRKNTVGSGFAWQNEEEGSSSSPHLPLSPSKGDTARGLHAIGDGGDGMDRYGHRLREMASENGMNGRSRGMRSSPPYGTDRPSPPPATMPTTTVPGGMI